MAPIAPLRPGCSEAGPQRQSGDNIGRGGSPAGRSAIEPHNRSAKPILNNHPGRESGRAGTTRIHSENAPEKIIISDTELPNILLTAIIHVSGRQNESPLIEGSSRTASMIFARSTLFACPIATTRSSPAAPGFLLRSRSRLPAALLAFE
jgi:hypothetical protein